MSTLTGEQTKLGLEQCDLRLTSMHPNGTVVEHADVVFYRLGFYNYHKCNMHDMLVRYEDKKWYAVDVLIDWSLPKQTTSIFIDKQPIA